MSTYNKDNLLTHLNLVTPAGYTLNDLGEFVKDEGSRICTLSLGYQEYFPFDVRFNGFGIAVCFSQVEQIYNTVSLQSNYSTNHTLQSATFYKGFRDDVIGAEDFENNVFGVAVQNDATFAQVRPYLEQLIQAGLDFLNQYQTLEDFYNYGESLTGQNKATFYQNPPVRLLIIKKLLSEPYDTLYQQYITRYNQLGRTDNANFLQSIKTHLDNL